MKHNIMIKVCQECVCQSELLAVTTGQDVASSAASCSCVERGETNSVRRSLVVGNFFLLTEGGLLVGVAGVTPWKRRVRGRGVGVRFVARGEHVLGPRTVAADRKECQAGLRKVNTRLI